MSDKWKTWRGMMAGEQDPDKPPVWTGPEGLAPGRYREYVSEIPDLIVHEDGTVSFTGKFLLRWRVYLPGYEQVCEVAFPLNMPFRKLTAEEVAKMTRDRWH